MSALRRGYLFAFVAYAVWGVFPVYFKLLRPTGPVEILAHRIVWSLAFVLLVLGVARRWRPLAELLRRPKTLGGVALAAAFIAVNWGFYIYGVNTDRVVETSLGYFINPLVTVLLGVIVLGERLRPSQWTALAVGALAVAVLTVDYGRLPWLALTLACSFGSYGLMKKRLGIPAVEGLVLETAVLILPALAYLGYLLAGHRLSFGHTSTGHTALLVSCGVLTAIPLMLFAGASNRLTLTAMGMMQYLTPLLQLGFGVLLFHEAMPPARLAGFGLVWVAIAVFSWDALRSRAAPTGLDDDGAAADDALPATAPRSASPIA